MAAAGMEQRLGRSAPRWHIDPDALAVLEAVFKLEQFPNMETRKQLGQDLQVSSRQIQVWFQNRRQRERKYQSISDLRSLSSASGFGDDALPGSPGRGLPLAPLPGDRCAADEGLARLCSDDVPLPDELSLDDLPALGPALGEDEEDEALTDLSNFVKLEAPRGVALTRNSSGSSSTTGRTEHLSFCPAECEPPPPRHQPSEAACAGACVLVAASHRAGAGWETDKLARSFDLPNDDLASRNHEGDVDAPPAGGLALPWPATAAAELDRERAESEVPVPVREPSVAARLASACQSALLGRTLQHYGGVVQVTFNGQPPHTNFPWKGASGTTRHPGQLHSLHKTNFPRKAPRAPPPLPPPARPTLFLDAIHHTMLVMATCK